MSFRRVALLSIGTLLCWCGAADAQIVNGDFEQGSLGWTVSAPPGWVVTFSPTGGNPGGCVIIDTPNPPTGSTDHVLIHQIVQGAGGGDPNCRCTLNAQVHIQLIGPGHGGTFGLALDCGDCIGGGGFDLGATFGWLTLGADVTCGTHDIGLVVTDPLGGGVWRVVFDNVTAPCLVPTVGVQLSTWSHIRLLYR